MSTHARCLLSRSFRIRKRHLHCITQPKNLSQDIGCKLVAESTSFSRVLADFTVFFSVSLFIYFPAVDEAVEAATDAVGGAATFWLAQAAGSRTITNSSATTRSASWLRCHLQVRWVELVTSSVPWPKLDSLHGSHNQAMVRHKLYRC